ncbi:MAG: GNAT family N-acetyltransferase [Chitinophagaceae bacterium]|nr:GNAT family N-acetyltransferase [Chitinophagaceae bacterium]
MEQNLLDQTVILEDEWVRLEPLEEKHYELLLPVAMHTDLWSFTSAKIKEPGDFKKYFETALLEKQQKRSYPFAYYNKQTNQYAGSTRFGNIDLANKKLEIGWTWIHPQVPVALFGFEQLQLNRIELKTSLLNLRSQKAMLKIGAVKEGVLRRHSINDDGTVRDTVYFSFIREEWPEIKKSIFGEFAV